MNEHTLILMFFAKYAIMSNSQIVKTITIISHTPTSCESMNTEKCDELVIIFKIEIYTSASE